MPPTAGTVLFESEAQPAAPVFRAKNARKKRERHFYLLSAVSIASAMPAVRHPRRQAACRFEGFASCSRRRRTPLQKPFLSGPSFSRLGKTRTECAAAIGRSKTVPRVPLRTRRAARGYIPADKNVRSRRHPFLRSGQPYSAGDPRRQRRRPWAFPSRTVRRPFVPPQEGSPLQIQLFEKAAEQIGRASCRERV